MASPQKENGYTPIANEIVEALARTRINGEAMQVLWVIIRKTYGFNKKEDAIALSQFVEITGLRRQTVYKAIHKLIALGVVTKKGSAIANKYCFVKNYALWQPEPKKVRGTKLGSVGTKKGSKSNPIRVIQKKKETIQKKEPVAPKDAPLIVALIDSFEGVNPTYKKWYGRPPQREACSRLISEHGLERVQRVIKMLPISNQTPYFPTITTPLQLEDKWAQLESAWKKKRSEQLTGKNGLA